MEDLEKEVIVNGFNRWETFFSGIAVIVAPLSAWCLGCKQQQQSVEDYYIEKIIEENFLQAEDGIRFRDG